MSEIDKDLYISINECPLCGTNDTKIIYVETNDFSAFDVTEKNYFSNYENDRPYLVHCCICDFSYLDRLPKDPAFYDKLYGGIRYDYDFEFKYHGKKKIQQEIKTRLQKYKTSGVLLDIGTWCGTLLAEMKDIYEVVGCELSTEAAAYGQAQGFDIRVGAFDQVEFRKESFDVITIIDVLEHLPQPCRILEKIYASLRPGGILYIKVPNGKSQLKKQRLLQSLRLSRQGVATNYIHINHFNHSSLCWVLNSIGFEVVEKGYTKAEIWNLQAPMTRGRRIKAWIDNQVKTSLTSLVGKLSIWTSLELGFNIFVIARKSFTTQD